MREIDQEGEEVAEFLTEGFTPETACRYVIDQLGVSPDMSILSSVDTLQTLGVALSERNTGLGVNATSAHVRAVYDQRLADGTLPAHLQTPQAFEERYHALVGHPDDVFARNEVFDSIDAHRYQVSRDVQSVFEQEVAKTLAPFVHKLIAAKSSLFQDILHSTTFYLERTQQGNFMCSGNGLRAILPASHAGVIQGAPTFNDTIVRWSEIGPSTWDNVALLSSTHFNEEFSRLIGPQLFDKSKKRVFATHKGLAEGAEELQRKMSKNKKIKQGFGAMILSDVRHRSIEEIYAAIDVAPLLLAKNGLLIISELDDFLDRPGSVFDLMKHARKVFGSDAYSVGLMTLDHGQEGSGRQATFIKT